MASPPRLFDWMDAAILSNRSACVEAYTSPEPKSRNAEPTLPTTRYLSPLSSDASDQTSRAHRTYSEMENSSRATNSTSRLLEAASRDMPATAVRSSAWNSLVRSSRRCVPQAMPTVATPAAQTRMVTKSVKRSTRSCPDSTSQSGWWRQSQPEISAVTTRPMMVIEPESTRARAPDTTALSSSRRHARPSSTIAGAMADHWMAGVAITYRPRGPREPSARAPRRRRGG